MLIHFISCSSPEKWLSRVPDEGVTCSPSVHQGSGHSWILVVARAWGHGRSWGPQVPHITENGGCGNAETSCQVRDSGGAAVS